MKTRTSPRATATWQYKRNYLHVQIWKLNRPGRFLQASYKTPCASRRKAEPHLATLRQTYRVVETRAIPLWEF